MRSTSVYIICSSCSLTTKIFKRSHRWMSLIVITGCVVAHGATTNCLEKCVNSKYSDMDNKNENYFIYFCPFIFEGPSGSDSRMNNLLFLHYFYIIHIIDQVFFKSSSTHYHCQASHIVNTTVYQRRHFNTWIWPSLGR